MVKLNSKAHVRELRERDVAELRGELEKLKKEYFDLRFKGATEAVKSPARFQQIRREVARINTIIRERERRASAAK